jgi:hypothetical protein
MSVTFYANIDETVLPKKKVRMVDIYPGLDNMDFHGDGFLCDEEGYYYEIQNDIDYRISVDFTNENFKSLLEVIDRNLYILSKEDGHCFALNEEQVPSFKRKLIKALNSSKTNHATSKPYLHQKEGQMTTYFGGYSKEQAVMHLEKMLEVCDTAMKANTYVYWA